MKQISVRPLVTAQVSGNLSDLPVRNDCNNPLAVAFCKPSTGAWVEVTNAEFLADVQAVAKGLMASGVRLGERIAIMSRTRYEWAVTDFAIWTAGAVSVPIYETSSALQVGWIVKDSGCAAVVLETPAHAAILAEAQADLPDLRHLWQIEAGGLDELRAAGREIPDEAVEARRAQVSRGDIATIIYTRDDRPPERVPAHPSQLHGSGRERDPADEGGRLCRRRIDLVVPAPGPRLRPLHPGCLRERRGPYGIRLRRQEPDRRLRQLLAHLHPVGAARLRKDLQLG